MRCLLVVAESIAPNDIAPAFDRRKVITSTVYPFYLGNKAPTVVSMLDHELISSMYSLSDGATFSGNRLARYKSLNKVAMKYNPRARAQHIVIGKHARSRAGRHLECTTCIAIVPENTRYEKTLHMLVRFHVCLGERTNAIPSNGLPERGLEI